MTTVFYRAQIDREKLREIILKNPGYLQQGLSFIDHQLGTQEQGIMDFLGVDKSGRLVVVNFEIEKNDLVLVAALSQIQWLKRNESLIKRLFFSENVDFNKRARILIIGPEFSEKLVSSVKQISGREIKLVEFKYIVADGKDAIIFEEIFSNQESSSRFDSDLLQKKAGIKEFISSGFSLDSEEIEKPLPELEEISLTPEEKAEFMDFDKELGK